MFGKLFGRRPGGRPKPNTPDDRSAALPPIDPGSSKDRNLDIPNRLEAGLQMRAVPEKQPGTPRAWNVTILRLDREGIWIARMANEVDPLPVSPKEILCLVLLDEQKQLSYDCPVIRVKAGAPELVLVGPPVKTSSESSKMSAEGLRQHFRVGFRFPCEIRSVSTKAPAMQLSGHTRDLSAGGVAIEVKQELPKGMDFELRVLSWNFPLKTVVRVVRCYELSPGVYVVAGIFPDTTSSISRELIAQFIAENQRGRKG